MTDPVEVPPSYERRSSDKPGHSHRIKMESVRVLIFAGVSMLALIPMWDASQVVFYFMGVMSLVALMSHLFRRLYFPYVEMGKYARKALETPIAAAIVFLAVTLLMCTIIIATSNLVGFKG